MRNELKGQDTGFIDRLIGDIMDLTEESERAGLGFQKHGARSWEKCNMKRRV